jgi:hypothetical protein
MEFAMRNPPGGTALMGGDDRAAREWAGGYDECLELAVSSITIDHDPELEAEADDWPPDAERMLFGEWAHAPGTTFRTCEHVPLGPLPRPGEDGAWYPIS